MLKLLARIDYGRNRGALRSNTMDDLKRKKFKRWVLTSLYDPVCCDEQFKFAIFLNRPPAKLFDPEKIRAIGGEISNDGDFTIFEGNLTYFVVMKLKNTILNS